MSRLIIKNLPNGVKEEKLRSLFGSKGQLTDCNLKFTRSGKFRKFAFVGFKREEDARNALKQFNNTYIDTSKIVVEIAKDFGDKNKPRAWSKYSKDSSSYLKVASASEKDDGVKTKETKEERKKKKKESLVNEMLGELKDDPKFQEFLEAHQKAGSKSVWSNDASGVKEEVKEKEQRVPKTGDESGSDSGSGSPVDEEPGGKEAELQPKTDDKKKLAVREGLSDLEYLKSKIGNKSLLSDSSSVSSDSDSDSETKSKKKKKKKKKKKEGKKRTEEEKCVEKMEIDSGVDTTPEKQQTRCKFLVKMKGLPVTSGEKAVKEFFKPIKTKAIRIPRNAQKKAIGVAYVEFGSENDLDLALRRNRNVIGGKRISVRQSKTSEDVQEEPVVDEPQAWQIKAQQQETSGEEEGIAESGRIFVRNLAYSCEEVDLEHLFGKYGPLTEVSLPVDSFTKKLKGFAFITYMMPEHAVKAYTELDGTVFQGRMLHILPGKSKKEEEDTSEGSSFKKQKQAKQKAAAGSSHNWNSLFLGASAVADVIAEKYGASKSHILDAETSESLGVRLALGETQIVAETRDFLIQNGVSLDSFSQAGGQRSKTVILVKNLPAGTKTEELKNIFSKYGTVGQILLPPSGITAIVEFSEPSEAKAAFTKLAYSKFQHVPLYLEWAPTEVFKAPIVAGGNDSDKQGDKQKTQTETVEDAGVENTDEKEEEEEQTEEIQPGCCLFVKNLNFDSTDDSLRQVFEKCGKVRSATIAKKKDMKNPGQFLSMGYGFVEYKKKSSADKALKELQHTQLDGHQLELKISNRETVQAKQAGRKAQKPSKQTSTKILVRNIPFEAQTKEIKELFKVFGELKFVRLPKKLSGTGSHRGFGFVDFVTKQDAKKAFEALCHSTHLYGRRLVLEWAETEDNVDQLRKRVAEHYHEGGPTKKLTKSSVMEQLQGVKDD